MPTAREVSRLRPGGDPERVREQLRDWNTPVIFEESERPAVRELRETWSPGYFRDLAGEFELSVRYYPEGQTSPVPEVRSMRFGEVLDHVAAPDGGNYSVRLNGSDPSHRERAGAVFADLERLSGDLASLTWREGLGLDTVWFGGPGTVTPLHYDPVSRLHGVVAGCKIFRLYPADRGHLKHLDVFPMRSDLRNYSRYGLGPLDSERFPALERCEPWEAPLGAGDVLYIPPCWWHFVTISEPMTLTSSVAYTQAEMYRQWAYWRQRLGKMLG